MGQDRHLLSEAQGRSHPQGQTAAVVEDEGAVADRPTEGAAIDSPRCFGKTGRASSGADRYLGAEEELGNECLGVETAMAKTVGYSLAEGEAADTGTEAEVAAQARTVVVEANYCEWECAIAGRS